ncbi:MAG: lysine biosynthesis protein LysX [Anaerolineales bacterium]|jgi:[lysine-biosynthesis-protein LysW]--L-2-aminoadipate ligase
MQIGMIVSRVRREEKLLMEAFQARDIQIDVFNDGEFILNPLDPDPRWLAYDLILERSISSSRTLTTLQILEAWGVPTLNNFHTASTCSDKLSTTLALARHSVPQAQVSIAFTEDSILQAIENQGYPAVLKPLTGSWGRLVTKVNDRESAEAILEHRFTLGNYPYHTGYVQEFVRKPNGRDIRSFVVGGQALCAIYRTSEHWITNTARGGVASNCEISGEIADISQRAAAAVGGGIVAIDLFETDAGYLVNEVNHSMEFRNSIEPTGVDIPAAIVEFALQTAAESAAVREAQI